MKYLIYCIVMLFIALGCEKKEPAVETPSFGKTFTNSIGMEFVYIPSGEFEMGSPSTELERTPFESPQHRIKLTKGFYMGIMEVAQSQYEEIMNCNPSHFREQNNPVEMVSWTDAVEFCRKLSEKEEKTYRLPTEAEWEYSCRAGTTAPFYTGDTISTDQANYNGNFIYGNGTKGVFRKKTMSVNSFSPNGFGLYNMHGNVSEWCQDWYGDYYYKKSPTSNPQGASSGDRRVLRGGSWNSIPQFLRSASRVIRFPPDYRSDDLGFRVVLESN